MSINISVNLCEATIDDLCIELPDGDLVCAQKAELPTGMSKRNFDYLIDSALVFVEDYDCFSAAYQSDHANGAERITMFLTDSMPEIGIDALLNLLIAEDEAERSGVIAIIVKSGATAVQSGHTVERVGAEMVIYWF